MTFRDYLVVMAVGTVAAWAAFLVVLGTTDPTHAGLLGFLLFYLTFFLAAVGSLSIAGAAVRVRFRPHELVSRQVAHAFRQGVLIAVLLVASLLLLAAGFFRVWTGVALVIGVACIELAFIGTQRPKTHEDV